MTQQPTEQWGTRPARQPASEHEPDTRQWPPVQPAAGAEPPASLHWDAQQNPASDLPRERRGCGRFALALLIAAALAALVLGLLMVGYATAARDLPQPEELRERTSRFASTLIYDREGGLISEIGDPNYGRRTAIPLERISPYLIDATVATEDPNFWQHPGVDPVGLARAFYYALRERDLSGPGGSTITQQLVKMAFLSPERTVSRKVKEAILAAEITRRYPRETILQIYLNEINYGNLAYGIEAAAETYFGVHASELTLAQAAMLAGLPQAPAYYDPYTKLWEPDSQPGAVKRRQEVVLRLMVERGYISPGQADAAWAEPLVLQPLKRVYSTPHPHFVLYTRSRVEEMIGPELISKGGLRIYTTLDPATQAAAEEELAAQVGRLAGQGATNGAVVAIRPATGDILAMAGSADFNDEAISGQINMALVPRQPGSAIKPLVYLAAFEMPAAVSTDPADMARNQAALVAAAQGEEAGPQISAIEPPGFWTPATAIMDIRTGFPDGANPVYVPENYDNREHGLVSVRTALANSYNIPAVKALQHAGLDRLKDVAQRAGITTLTRADYGLSLALGGGEVTLLELTGAYAALANAGVRAPVSPVACILDESGRLIWRGAAAERVPGCLTATQSSATLAVTPSAPQAAFDPRYAYLITSILSDAEARAPMFGASAALSLGNRPAAVKTGTTNDYRDAWTVGYTPDLAVGVWVGDTDTRPMQELTGSIAAAPIWHGVMARSLEGQPVQQFVQPAGIERAAVCAESGTLPSEACPVRREELFAAGQGPLPAGYDLWQRVRIDRITGQPATGFTPQDRIETVDRMVFPPAYRAWAEANGYPLLAAPPIAYSFQPELALYSPADGSLVSGVTPVFGRVRIPSPLVWRLEYGVGRDPIGWGVLSGPNPADPAAEWERDMDGALGEWDVPATAIRHGVWDFTLRLAAYDPANFDYPAAVSAAAYVILEQPTPQPTPTETPEPTPTPEPSPTPLPTEEWLPEATPTPEWLPEATPTPEWLPEPTSTPELPPEATPTPELPPEPTVEPTPGPPEVFAVLLQPVEGDVVTGQVEVWGVADGPGFAWYVIEYAAGYAPSEADWLPADMPGYIPMPEGLLGFWDTDPLETGAYSLRLVVYDAAGAAQISQVTLQVVR